MPLYMLYTTTAMTKVLLEQCYLPRVCHEKGIHLKYQYFKYYRNVIFAEAYLINDVQIVLSLAT